MDKRRNTIEMTGLADPQIHLGKALASRNIEEFRAALAVGAHPLATDDRNLSVFEKALQTAGCAEFVEECLKRGCDPNYINKYYKKSAINYASDSKDTQILKLLLSQKGVNVNFEYSKLTPLNSLAKNLSPENLNDSSQCIKILLQYGASPNIADQREMTPLHYVVKNHKIDKIKRQEIVQLFLALPDLDIDTYRMGELRTLLEENYPNLKLPGKQANHIKTYHMLLTHIRNDDMNKFQQDFTDSLRNTTDEENQQLLMRSIESGAHKAFDLLMESGVDYNKPVGTNENTPLEISCIYGNWYALEKLLQKSDLQLRPTDYPLIAIIRKLNEDSLTEFCDYWKCFYILLNSDKIDINRVDKSRSSPLHYAVKYRNNKAIRELLNKGADISIKSVFNDLPISGMSPEVLANHFDTCITANDAEMGEENYEMYINFRNLRPEKNSSHQLREEMSPIAYMAETKEYRHLLSHPVITSVLFLKWHKISFVFYINFLIYVLYALSVISYAVLTLKDSKSEEAILITGLISWFGICYLTIRECLQFIIGPIRYICSLTNYIEISLIVLSVLTCRDFNFDKDVRRQIAVFTILLAAVELCLQVGSLPVTSISTHMLMLETVCKSFFKSFLLYSIFVVTFTLCFHLMNDKPDDSGSDSNDEETFHKFAKPLEAFSKTLVMLTGEFDAGSLRLDSPSSYVVFLLFVIFMTVILFNLLNGLAVSDTQFIKDQAELNYLICRTKLLTRYEQLLIERTRHAKSLVNHEPLRTLWKIFLKIYPDYSTGTHISIFPNNNNKIIMPKLKANKRSGSKTLGSHQEIDVDVPLTAANSKTIKENLSIQCCFHFITGNCCKIDNRTVQLAMAILEQKSVKSIENRLENMEEKLEQILTNMERHKS